MRVQFGDCTLDSDTRELLRGGTVVHLEPKAYRLLEILLAERPKALSKEVLQDALWPKTFVSELTLSRLVSVLRRSVGDRGKSPRLIRTVHGFGYAFSGEVATATGPAPRAVRAEFRCRIMRGGQEFPLAEGDNLLGRDPAAAVSIDLASVSRRHAHIFVAGGTATIEDLGSRNGTLVRGRRITAPTKLESGDRIKVGASNLVFRRSRRLGTTESEISSRSSGPVQS